ncbi:MAG: ROK family protein [Bifidobacteriaceae bacterium]|jgi:hypothetical protein|nr:ROK family protein [Bifidobacteriaceae bacterium]
MNNGVSGPKPADLLPASILGLLGARGPLTRAELASAPRVSSATITGAAKGLMARGMVVEVGQLASGGGRPARPLSLASTAGRMVGVEVTASHLAVVAAKFDGEVPVLVENDINALAVAEQVYGAGVKYSTYLIVTIGRGIGCGIVIGGEVFRGSGGGAGEIGHFPLQEDGPPCPYGHSGCLESLIGTAGLVCRAVEMGLLESPGAEEPRTRA